MQMLKDQWKKELEIPILPSQWEKVSSYIPRMSEDLIQHKIFTTYWTLLYLYIINTICIISL